MVALQHSCDVKEALQVYLGLWFEVAFAAWYEAAGNLADLVDL